MTRELLNRDGSPMREYHSPIIEELLNETKMRIPRKLKKKIKKSLPNTYSIDFERNKKQTSMEYVCIKRCKFYYLGLDQIKICKLTNEVLFENCKSCKKRYHENK